MEFFAIQHVPTGRLLPAPRGRGGRGGTHVEFGDAGMPRLFNRESTAKTALTYWLSGKINVSFRGGDVFLGEDGDEHWSVTPTPHRVAEECSVVRVTLEVASRG